MKECETHGTKISTAQTHLHAQNDQNYVAELYTHISAERYERYWSDIIQTARCILQNFRI